MGIYFDFFLEETSTAHGETETKTKFYRLVYKILLHADYN